MSGPKTTPAPGDETEGEVSTDRADRNKKNVNTVVNLPDPRVFIAPETVCPLACSAEPGRCSWSCAPLSIRDSEIAL